MNLEIEGFGCVMRNVEIGVEESGCICGFGGIGMVTEDVWQV